MENFLSASSPAANMLRHLHKSTKVLTEAQAAGGIGHAETQRKVLTWDGDAEDISKSDIFDAPTIKMADEFMDLNYVAALTIKYSQLHGGEEITVSTKGDDALNVEDAEGAQLVQFGEGISLFSIPSTTAAEWGASEGVYVVGENLGLFWLSAIYFEFETIHPIDPKFLPDNTLGEDVWGSHMETAFMQALEDLMSNGTRGAGVAVFTPDDVTTLLERCRTADRVRFSLSSMGVSAEAQISEKVFDDEWVYSLSSGAIVSTGQAIVDSKCLISLPVGVNKNVSILVWLSTLGAAT